MLLAASLLSLPTLAEQDDGNDDYAQGDDGDDDAAQAYYYNNGNDDNDDGFSAGDDYIKYWTDYAILPKRCIV